MINVDKLANAKYLDRVNQRAVGSLKEWGILELEKISSIGNGECWKCPIAICNFMFEDIVGLKLHYLKDHNIRPYICNTSNCTWKFPTKAKLERHVQAHETKKLFKCSLENCNKLFTTVSNMKQHVKKVHELFNKFSCDFDNCSAIFHNQKGLECHRATHEGAIPEYSCKLASCGKSFFTNNALCTHMKSHERKTSDLKCKICDKLFDIPCRFKSHMLSHESNKPFQCPEIDCTFSFLSPSKLNRHMKTHSEIRKFGCTFQGCSKAFKRREHLMDHERSIHFKKQKSTLLHNNQDSSQALRHLERNIHISKKMSETLRDEAKEEYLSPSKCVQESSVHSACFGSARTSLVYRDIVQGKLAPKPNSTNGKVSISSNIYVVPTSTKSRSKNIHVNPVESTQGDAPQSIQEDLMLSSTNIPDSSSLSLQEEFLSQEYFLLDSSNRLSDFEPSTINLRDLE